MKNTAQKQESGNALAGKLTAQKMINAAEQLFWYKGYQATSLDDIAKQAGQSKGAFFHYFSSKEDVLIYAIKQYASHEIFERFDRLEGEHGSLKEMLFSWAREHYDALEKRKFKGGCMLGNMALELCDHSENVQEELSHIFLEYENRLVSLFRPSDKLIMEPRQFARLLVATHQGIMMNVKAHKDARRAARDFQALTEIIERLIRD